MANRRDVALNGVAGVKGPVRLPRSAHRGAQPHPRVPLGDIRGFGWLDAGLVEPEVETHHIGQVEVVRECRYGAPVEADAAPGEPRETLAAEVAEISLGPHHRQQSADDRI